MDPPEHPPPLSQSFGCRQGSGRVLPDADPAGPGQGVIKFPRTPSKSAERKQRDWATAEGATHAEQGIPQTLEDIQNLPLLNPASKKLKEDCVNRFMNWRSHRPVPFGKPDTEPITTDDVQAFVAVLHQFRDAEGKPYSISRFNQYLWALEKVCSFNVRQTMTDEFKKISKSTGLPVQRAEVLPLDYYHWAISHALELEATHADVRNGVLATLGINGIQRENEILRARIEHFTKRPVYTETGSISTEQQWCQFMPDRKRHPEQQIIRFAPTPEGMHYHFILAHTDLNRLPFLQQIAGQVLRNG